MKYEFHVGDKVQIREWDDMKDEFGVNAVGEVATRAIFTKDMRKLCGRTAIIYDIREDRIVKLTDWDDSRGTSWAFDLDMLKPYEIVPNIKFVVSEWERIINV
jgi:hypothetical protein